jgi:hypothetical protein
MFSVATLTTGEWQRLGPNAEASDARRRCPTTLRAK